MTDKINYDKIYGKVVLFNEKDVKAYLDRAIRSWRDKKVKIKGDVEEELVCACYIDAFQSMRMSLFGETLPEEE